MASAGTPDMGDISAPGSAYMRAFYAFGGYREDTENVGIVHGGMGVHHAVDGPLRGGVWGVDQDRCGGEVAS